MIKQLFGIGSVKYSLLTIMILSISSIYFISLSGYFFKIEKYRGISLLEI